MTSPMVEELGFLGDTPACEAILNGSYIPPPGTDPYMVEFLRELATPTFIRNKPTSILTTDMYIAGWKRSRWPFCRITFRM